MPGLPLRCSICGHVGCRHTDVDRRYRRALERRVWPHRQVAIAPALAEMAWESYSGDTIAETGRIRRPFLLAGEPYCNVGGDRQEFEAYRVVARREFKAPVFRYGGEEFRRSPYYDPKLRERFEGDQQRFAPKGFYHAMSVRCGGHDYVLVGPPIEFRVAAPLPLGPEDPGACGVEGESARATTLGNGN